MTKLLIDNVATGTSDEEVKELLLRYGFPPWDAVEHLPGDGSRITLMLTFSDTSPAALHKLQARIHKLFWNNRTLDVEVRDWHSESEAGS